jgi:hypothetical protein
MAETAAQWYDLIGRFKNKYTEFLNVREDLIRKYPLVRNNPALLAEWQKMLSNSDSIYKTVTIANEQIDKAKNWLRDTFGFNLGLLPAVPIAVGAVGVAGAIAAMTYFITDYMSFSSRVAIFEKTGDKSVLESSGGVAGGLRSVSDIFKNILPVLVIGGILYYAPKMLKGARRE